MVILLLRLSHGLLLEQVLCGVFGQWLPAVCCARGPLPSGPPLVFLPLSQDDACLVDEVAAYVCLFLLPHASCYELPLVPLEEWREVFFRREAELYTDVFSPLPSVFLGEPAGDFAGWD